ncbi:Uncharacterised protein [Helicobacter muridarum]|nr:Uncharacterised protein [Helicobacter muridarum]
MLSICFKSLCSYEYMTSITIFALSPFLISFLFSLFSNESVVYICKGNSFKVLPCKIAFKYTIILFILSIAGFLLAFIWQAFLRGDGDILLGLSNIYHEDFLRRMIGGKAKDFDNVYADSLNANIFIVTYKYIEHKYFLSIFGKDAFSVFSILSILMLILIKKVKIKYLLLLMFIIFALSSISWFVFGKAHSYIHTHMNFVLWSLGFSAVILYIPIIFIYNIFCKILDIFESKF